MHNYTYSSAETGAIRCGKFMIETKLKSEKSKLKTEPDVKLINNQMKLRVTKSHTNREKNTN